MRQRKAIPMFLLLLILPLSCVLRGQSLPGHDTAWMDNITAEQEAQQIARRRARQPFEKWQAYIVVAVIGSEFIEVRMPPNYSTVHRQEKGRWSVEIWKHGRQIITCQWRGEKVVGMFPVSGEIMECGYRNLDEGFYARCANDPLWADVAPPEGGR